MKYYLATYLLPRLLEQGFSPALIFVQLQCCQLRLAFMCYQLK